MTEIPQTTALEPAVIRPQSGPPYSEDQREVIRFVVRQALYRHFDVPIAHIREALRAEGFEMKRQLVQHYVAEVQREDAKTERLRLEAPDVVALRTEQRKHREAVFNQAMRGKDYGAANRALDALAALDGIATSKASLSLVGKDGQDLLDVGRMSDADLQAYRLSLGKAGEKTETAEEEAHVE